MGVGSSRTVVSCLGDCEGRDKRREMGRGKGGKGGKGGGERGGRQGRKGMRGWT